LKVPHQTDDENCGTFKLEQRFLVDGIAANAAAPSSDLRALARMTFFPLIL
jgi:hypothetical protein